ncbi:MAG: threonine aldolase, partial [Porticoccaceae bacterium]
CMPDYWRRAKQLAVMFQDILNVRCVPSVPQANMMHIYLPFSADSANAARDQVVEEQGIKLFGRAMVAGVKESYFELSVGDKLLGTTDQQVAELFERFMSIGNQKALAHG